MTAEAREAARQRALLDAIGGQPAGVPDDADGSASNLAGSATATTRGIAAYRANAAMLAERALSGAFATVHALVGTDAFAALARGFWRAHPPQSGDLGEWGENFAAWIVQQPALGPWPYIGDCARLDFALHRCERADDAAFDAASLALLQSEPPHQLCLHLMPGTVLLRSDWPVATIHAAHRPADPGGGNGNGNGADFAAVREAVAARRGERVLVVRHGWRAAVHPIDEIAFAWTRLVLDGVDLSGSLDRAPAAFDFAAWLEAALRGGWLQRVALIAA